jgi:two-component system, LuxR family, sensor kinase FixL
MSWITFIWSLTAGICLTLGAVHFLVWTRRRDEWANLVFSIAAAAAAGYAVLDMVALRDRTAAEYGELWRWALALGLLEGVLIAWFIRLYLQAGRPWLLWLICGLRALMLVLNFVPGPNFYFREITGLQQAPLLGELISRPHGVLHPWVMLMPLSFLLIIFFALDAAHTAARRSRGRRAWVLGGLLAVGFSLALVSYALYAREVLPSTFSSQLFLSVILLMGYELSLDVLRASQLSRELLETQQRMRLAARAADLSFFEWDIARDEIWVTERGRERAGVGASERIDFARFLQALHPDDREPTQRAVRHSLAGTGEYEAEYRVTDREGAARWVVARGHVEYDAHHQPLRLRGVSVNITERKEAEVSLRQSEEFQKAILDSVAAEIAVLDAQGVIVAVNSQWQHFALENAVSAGQPPRNTGIGVNYLEVCRQSTGESFDTAMAAQEGIQGVISGRIRNFSCEYACHSPQQQRWFVMSVTPLKQEKRSVVVAHLDITDRKKAEDQLAQQRNELSHLSRVTTMSELSGSLAHELNQPLAIILTNAQAAQRLLAQDPPDVAETRDILADIVSEDERAGEVIRRLRALLKPGQTQRLPLSVNEIIEDVLRIARSDLIGRGVTVHTALAENLPQVLGDRVQLQQVLLNLILNACDAMAGNPPAHRHLTVATARHDGLARVSVSDNGCGLPVEPERIFQPFYTTKKDGLGLGLPICRSIVTAHQGRLWGKNGAAGGAVIHLELPAGEGGSGNQ